MRSFVQALPSFSKVKNLDLMNNKLGDEAMKMLAPVLEASQCVCASRPGILAAISLFLPGAREKLCDLSSVQSPHIVVHLCDTHHCSVDVLSHSEITHEKKLIKVFTPMYGDETGTVEVWLPANTEKHCQRKQMLHTQPRHVLRVMLVQGDAPKKAASVSHHARQWQRKRNLHRPVFSVVSGKKCSRCFLLMGWDKSDTHRTCPQLCVWRDSVGVDMMRRTHVQVAQDRA